MAQRLRHLRWRVLFTSTDSPRLSTRSAATTPAVARWLFLAQFPAVFPQIPGPWRERRPLTPGAARRVMRASTAVGRRKLNQPPKGSRGSCSGAYRFAPLNTAGGYQQGDDHPLFVGQFMAFMAARNDGGSFRTEMSNRRLWFFFR